MKQIFTTMLCVSSYQKTYRIYGCGGLLLVLSVVMGFSWSSIANKILQHEFELRDGSEIHKNWMHTPIPIYVKYRMFNWTNSEDIYEPNYKPNLVELGPYVFLEKHTRVNVSFHPENDTVTFDQIRTWHFMPDMSNGTLDDKITNVNVIAATAAHTLQNSFNMMKFGINQLMKLLRVKITVTKTVRELIYDGYEDKLLNFIHHVPLVSKPPFKKFGWFVDRNSSWTYDGHFEMRSGLDDITQMGQITKWNYMDKTKFHYGRCGQVDGTTGEVWPMNLSPTDDITVFVTDLCRPLTLAYDQKQEMLGVMGNRWVGDYRVFDNGDRYLPNRCFGTKWSFPELKTGVQDLSRCRYGAPVFASFPHFYLADKSYVNAVNGIHPQRSEHEFSMNIEPNTGIPLNVDAKIQINMLIQPIKGFAIYENVTSVMIPVLWFSQNVEISEELAQQAKIALILPSIGSYIAFGVAGFLSVMLLFGALLSWTKSTSSLKTPIID